MENKKDKQRDSIILEMVAWAFVIGIVYFFFKVFN
jgi:hypothetical protein